MGSELFVNYVQKLGKTFFWKDRKVALILDNLFSHLETENLKTTELKFLAPNTTVNQSCKTPVETHQSF